jgi:hypothetical protein
VRRGRVLVNRPTRYACTFGSGGGYRIRLPLAFSNTGPAAIVIEDLRLLVNGREPAEWITNRHTLKPQSEDVLDFAGVLVVPGRGASERFVELGRSDDEWVPDEFSVLHCRLEGSYQHSRRWHHLTSFELVAPEGRSMRMYLAHLATGPTSKNG